MTRAARHKNLPLSLRVFNAELALIDRAARRRGCSRAAFIRDAAVRAADNAIMEHVLTGVSSDQFSAAFATVRP